MSELLFSVTKNDFIVTPIKHGGGAGGQKKNKSTSACRISHPESGVTAEAHDSRSLHENKMDAFHKVVNTPKFQKWLKIKSAEKMGEKVSLDEKVEQAMKETKNFRLEVRENDRWIEKPYPEVNLLV
jgi:protein subunit release factor B